MADASEKLTEVDRGLFREAIEKARARLTAEDAESLKTAQADLEKESHRLADLVYKTTQEAPAGEAGAPGKDAAGETVVDAEYEDVKKNPS